MTIELFDARMLAPLIKFVDRNGDRSESYLDRASIPGELIEEGGWIGKKQAYDFTFDVVNRTRTRSAVFAAYLDFQLEHLGPIADAMKACRTVKEALEVGARLGSVAYEGNEYFLETDGDVTWFCYREPKVISAGQTFINDMTLAVYCQLIRATVDQDWRPRQLRTRGEMNDRHSSLEAFADCVSVRHSDSTGLAFPTAFLQQSTSWSRKRIVGSSAKPWQFGPSNHGPVVEKLHRILSAQLHHGPLPTLAELASMVDVGPSTLKRQLGAAGMTYGQLLDGLRFDAACEMLLRPRMTVSEIARELGYSGTSNFVRSFRRMTGTTPGEYRKHQSEEGSAS